VMSDECGMGRTFSNRSFSRRVAIMPGGGNEFVQTICK
jgi:hypothetical protein